MSSSKIEKARSLLGVPSDANKDEVKLAYRRACAIHHPDRGGDRNKFDEINKAYRVLIKHVEKGRECETCIGTGKVAHQRGFNTTYIKCTACKGTGTVHG